MVKIAIIGGSGLEDPKILEGSESKTIETKYGNAEVTTGKIKGVDIVLVSRHGKEHTITPSNVNNRANITAITELGCTHIIATTAVGSLKREIGRGDLVFIDQFIDFTRFRPNTFQDEFEPHKPIHCAMSTPFNEELRKLMIDAAKELNLKHHEKGAVVTIEGPRFSTKAESKMFSIWGADIINMSIAPECMLANEAKIPYAAVAMSTDYDCLFDDVEPVTWEEVLKVFKENVDKVVSLLIKVIPQIQ